MLEPFSGQPWAGLLLDPHTEQSEAYKTAQGLLIREVCSHAAGGARLRQPLWRGVLVSPE